MAGATDILLKVILAKSIPKHSVHFVEKHRNNANLLRINMWDNDILQRMRIELQFFIKCRAQNFSAVSDIDSVQKSFDNGRDWEYSSCLARIMARKRSISRMREITIHATGNLSQAVRPIVQGMRKFLSSTIGFDKIRSGVTPHLPYSNFSMSKMCMLIAENSALVQLNERFTSTKISGFRFQCCAHVDQREKLGF